MNAAAADPNAWLNARWSLRGDIRALARPEGDGRVSYVLEDPLQTKFFQIGAAEYAFISRLDGQRTVEQVLEQTPAPQRLSREQAQRVINWLVSSQLVRMAGAAQGQRLYEMGRSQSRKEQWQRYNPLTARLPLTRPDAMLSRLAPRFTWLRSKWFLLLTAALAVIACGQVAEQWPRVQSAAKGVLSPDRWLWLAGCWLLLKVIHELAHGLVCRLYGGNVREAGVMLLYFFPVAYVDVTSSWRFRSKWQRIHTAAAGMQVELLIASVAALVWCGTRVGVLNDLCFSLTVSASVTTLVFNANPLMRFDGYYILSDLLGIPNLYAGAQQRVAALAKQFFLGLPSAAPAQASGPRWLLLTYGIAVLCWRVLVIGGILLMLSQLFYGAGLVLAAFVAVSWAVVPLTRLLKYVANSEDVTPSARRRLGLTSGVVVAAGAVLLLLPWAPRPAAPAIVDFAPLTVVRAASDGFVEQVLVEDGQQVAAGQPLLKLVNRELEFEVRQRRRAVQSSEVELRRRQQKGDHGGYQAEQRRLQSRREQLAESQQLLDSHTVNAPVAGRVLCRQLPSMLGRFFQAGDELLAIGDESQKELQISIDQRQLDGLQSSDRARVRVRIAGHRPFRAEVDVLEPMASVQPLHESLCAPAGGSLPVVLDDDRGEMQLVQPRFTATVRLAPDLAAQVRAGRRAAVVLELDRQPLLSFVRGKFRDWLDARL